MQQTWKRMEILITYKTQIRKLFLFSVDIYLIMHIISIFVLILLYFCANDFIPAGKLESLS